MDFETEFWPLVAGHGRVARYYKSQSEALWKRFTAEQQQAIYDTIEMKLNTGKFVSYRPNEAIEDNAPKAPKIQVISYDEHYRRYGTDVPQDGWVKKFLPEQHKTIYVKAG